MNPQKRLEERAAIISNIVKGLQDVIVSETPTEDDGIEAEISSPALSAGRSASVSGIDSSDSGQPLEERDWINNTPKWSPPTELALHSSNHLSTPEWRRACGVLNVVIAKAEKTNVHKDPNSESFEPSLFTTLVIKPRKKDLRKLKHAIQQPVQPPYLGEFYFDCSAIKTKKDVADLEKCREPIVDILKLLYAQGHDAAPVHPLRDALILLLEAFLCAVETKQELWFNWNGDDPKIEERPSCMEASCCLTYAGLGPFGRELPRYQAWFDYGLDIGSFTVSDSGEKTVQESWLCCFEDDFDYGRVLINGWPGSKRPYLDYNLTAFEALMQCTDLRRIEIRNTRVHLGGLLSLLNRNRHTLDILILEQVEANEDINA
ncbi:hypothetical protein KCU65_g2859, partial [Aureobasidium melanogenum]